MLVRLRLSIAQHTPRAGMAIDVIAHQLADGCARSGNAWCMRCVWWLLRSGVLAVVTWVLPLQPPQHITAVARESMVQWLMSSLTPSSGREGTNGRGGSGRGGAIPHFLSDDARATARLSPRQLTAALMAVLLGAVPEGEGAGNGGEASDGRGMGRDCWWDASADGVLVEEALGRLNRPHSFMGLRTATSHEVNE